MKETATKKVKYTVMIEAQDLERLIAYQKEKFIEVPNLIRMALKEFIKENCTGRLPAAQPQDY